MSASGRLARLESNLARTQEAVSSLRDLLDGPQASPVIDHRYVSATSAAVITDIVDKSDALTWYYGAMGERTEVGWPIFETRPQRN